MNAQESISTENVLKRHGYDCEYVNGAVEVKDPVHTIKDGQAVVANFKTVVVRTYGEACKFISDRE